MLGETGVLERVRRRNFGSWDRLLLYGHNTVYGRFFFSRVADEDELERGHSRSRNGVDPVAEWNHTHQRSCSATEDYFEEE